jgi:hypothetical protein
MRSFLLLFSIAFLLFSCGTNEASKEATPAAATRPADAFDLRGVIQKIEANPFATHLLFNNEGGVTGKPAAYGLKSDKVDLDAWVNQKVIVTARKAAADPANAGGPEVIEVLEVKPDSGGQ